MATPSYQIKQSETTYPLVFLLVSSTDHINGVTGANPTVTISKAGGAFASPAGAVSEIAHGWYQVAGNATDSGTLGLLLLHATATGADPVDALYEVVPPGVNVTQVNGVDVTGTALATDGSGRVKVAADGLDAVVPETGYNVRQLLALIAAATCGDGTDFDTSSPVFHAAGNPSTTRVAVTTTASGRSATLTPPA